MEEEIWKVIPGYEPYEASNLGRVKLGNKLIRAYKTNRGYYRMPLHESTSKKFLSVHRAVALAHLEHDINKSQVNHIDGNKANNCLNNLEWTNGKENVAHAFKTGLRNDNVYVTLKNIITDEQQKFLSLTDLTKYLNIAMDTLVSYIPRSSKYPMYDKYKVIISDAAKDRMLTGVKSFYKKVYVKDHTVHNSAVKEYISVARAVIDNGMNSYSIREALGKKQKPYYYIGGYTFSYDKDNLLEAPDIDKDIALKDKNKIWSKPLVKINNTIELLDYDTGEVKEFNNRQEVVDYLLSKGYTCDDAGVTGAITRGRKKGISGILRGFGIQFKDDNDKWFEYTKRQIMNSRQGLDLNTRILEIIDNEIKTTYYGLLKVSMKYGLKLATLKDMVNKGEKELNAFFERNNIDATVVII